MLFAFSPWSITMQKLWGGACGFLGSYLVNSKAKPLKSQQYFSSFCKKRPYSFHLIPRLFLINFHSRLQILHLIQHNPAHSLQGESLFGFTADFRSIFARPTRETSAFSLARLKRTRFGSDLPRLASDVACLSLTIQEFRVVSIRRDRWCSYALRLKAIRSSIFWSHFGRIIQLYRSHTNYILLFSLYWIVFTVQSCYKSFWS